MYSKERQTRRKKKKGYGRSIPRATAKMVIGKAGNRCEFSWELFQIHETDCEIHHIHGRRNRLHKHDPANLIYISREVHFAIHHRGFWEYNGHKMYTPDLKQALININIEKYGKEAVEVCR